MLVVEASGSPAMRSTREHDHMGGRSSAVMGASRVVFPCTGRLRKTGTSNETSRYSVSTFPQTPMDWPEMFAPARDRRNITVSATSRAVTMRRSDTRSR